MTTIIMIGFAFGVGYAWANFGRRFRPIGVHEVWWGGEPTIRDDGTYSDVGRRREDGNYLLLYRAKDGEVLHGGLFKTARAAKAWRP